MLFWAGCESWELIKINSFVSCKRIISKLNIIKQKKESTNRIKIYGENQLIFWWIQYFQCDIRWCLTCDGKTVSQWIKKLKKNELVEKQGIYREMQILVENKIKNKSSDWIISFISPFWLTFPVACKKLVNSGKSSNLISF